MSVKQAFNRVENDLHQWRSREERFTQLFPSSESTNKVLLKEKLNYYDAVAAKYQGSANQEEKFALRLLK